MLMSKALCPWNWLSNVYLIGQFYWQITGKKQWKSARLDWAIGFKGDKGSTGWINLGIVITIGRACASIIWTTPRRDWAIVLKSGKGIIAAIKADGSIKAWGHRKYGGAGAPSDKGYTKIYSNNAAFAALKADGSIASWYSHYQRVHLYLHYPIHPTPWLSHRL
jgi:hypothetical protein